jgi:hypothetical protein
MQNRQSAAVFSCEIEDDRFRQISEFVERCNNLPMWEVRGFVHAYEHGELNLGLRLILGEEANYGFIISAAHPSGRNKGESRSRFVRSRNSDDVGHDLDSEKTLMLPNNVQQVKGVQKFIPSFVRFQRFDDSSFFGGKGLYEFAPFVVPERELFGAPLASKFIVLLSALARRDCPSGGWGRSSRSRRPLYRITSNRLYRWDSSSRSGRPQRLTVMPTTALCGALLTSWLRNAAPI